MAGLVNSIGEGLTGIKRAFDTFIGHDSDTKDDAQPSEGSRSESTHRTSTTSPGVQSRNKRPRIQPTTDPNQSALLSYPKEQPRSKRESSQPSPDQGRAALAKEYLYRIQPSYDITHLTMFSYLEESLKPRQTTAHSSSGRERGQQRANQRRAVASADEKRLFADSHLSTEGSTIIPVPSDDWASMSNTRRKVASGSGFRPGNTLNRPGPGLNALPTVSSRGANVSNNTAKRQKTNHEFMHDDTNDIPEYAFGNRGLQGLQEQHPTAQRQPSIISLNSQSQETPSQKTNPFTHDEVRNVHSKLNYSKKKGRKPKAGGALQSSPPQGGTFTDPVSVDDNDDVQILSDQRSPPRSIDQKEPPRVSRGEADRRFLRRITAQETRSHAKPATQVLDRIEVDPPRSPLLAETFVRDDGESGQAPVLHQAQQKIKNRMQSTSNTARPLQNQQTIEDSSADELSREPVVQSSARKSKHTAAQRSPSPNHIPSTYFTKGRRKAPANITIALSSLRMKAGNWEDLFIIYSWDHKAMQFIKNDNILSNGGVTIQLSSKHVHTLFCSSKDSNEAIFGGCNDSLSSGKIYFELATAEAFDTFLEAASHMNDRAKVRDLPVDKFTHVREGSETFFRPAANTADPELEAMRLRQGTNTVRERALAAQRGFSLPESTAQTTPVKRTRAMRSDFANQPAKETVQDLSLPPPTSRFEQSTPVRSSRRLQSKDSSKAVIVAEPEVERWTVKHGIPKWDAPLTYPPVGTNRTTIDAEDIARLDDGELLNDNIISFCLREMQEKNPDLKGKAHIFNSFFYETLSTLPSRKRGFNYEGVKRWTRNIDLFSHSYVAVPINTQYHWFLVIICNLDKLERKLKLEGLEDNEEEEPEAEPQPIVEEPLQSQSTVSNDIEIPESPPQDSKDDGLSQGVKRISLDASQEQEEDLPPLGKLKPVSRKGKKQAPPLPKVDPNTPALIILDSLSGTHTQEVKNLKQYVVHEGRDKRGLEFEYTELKGMNARGLPQQTNFCDCGVYLIGYMEAFLRDPAEFVRKVMSRELDHNNDFADFDPSKKRAEIREKLIKLEEEQSLAKKQRKKEKARLQKMANQDNSTTSPVPMPKQMSSPMKPPEAQTDSRMVQSSPMKPPPPPIHKLREPSPYKSISDNLAPSHRSPPVVERSVDDEMLFDNNGYTDEETSEPARLGSHDDYSFRQNDDHYAQPSVIHSQMNFRNELEQAAQHASQRVYQEE
ncbi:cysteine proteinase, partial [Aureobasidium melanogenum]